MKRQVRWLVREDSGRVPTFEFVGEQTCPWCVPGEDECPRHPLTGNELPAEHKGVADE